MNQIPSEQRRKLLLVLMAGQSELAPFLFLLNSHPKAPYIITSLITRGIIGDELKRLVKLYGSPELALRRLGGTP